MKKIPIKGSSLNALSVLIGSSIGLAIGHLMTHELKQIAVDAMSIIIFALGCKMFMQGKELFLVTASVTLGGLLGFLLGIPEGLKSIAEVGIQLFGGQNKDAIGEAFLSTTVLFCIGPVTIMGCIQEALENKIEIISLKALLDGFFSIFMAATLGPGVFLTAGSVFVIQSLFCLTAKKLQPIVGHTFVLDELAATGGAILIMIALDMLNIKNFSTVCYTPALILTPLFMKIFYARKFSFSV